METNTKHEPRYMYHSFPRRTAQDRHDEKALKILSLICEFGLLLTPEIEKWVDQKMPPSKSEEYIAVSRRCCFTELAPSELPAHAKYFGEFGLEFETRVLCDMGAMPVFYIPRISDSNGYGVGPAFVTQLAHVQEVLQRLSTFLQFAKTVGARPDDPLQAYRLPGGGIAIRAIGAGIGIDLPAELIERVKAQKPEFVPPPIPPEGLPFGMNAGALLSLLNIFHWGLHSSDVMLGTIKALGSVFYSTERVDDPLLSHYRQREWRIIGGILKDQVAITQSVPGEMKGRLLALDPTFFAREMEMPIGTSRIVDECEVYARRHSGEAVMSLARRLISPARAGKQVHQILANRFPSLEVADLESF